jgi:WXG100 family type VII secretion target
MISSFQSIQQIVNKEGVKVAERIRANYPELEEIAGQFQKRCEVICEMTENLCREADELHETYWWGEASDRFHEEFNTDVIPRMRRLCESLDESANTLKRIQEIFAETERECRAHFNF